MWTGFNTEISALIMDWMFDGFESWKKMDLLWLDASLQTTAFNLNSQGS